VLPEANHESSPGTIHHSQTREGCSTLQPVISFPHVKSDVLDAERAMTATIQLTDDDLKDLRELTHKDDAEGAVRSALDEYRRYARRMRLKELSGQVAMDDNWRALESAETDGPRPH